MNSTPAIIGRYQVKRWLASGAMGEVFEAYDPFIDRPVAIKCLHREFLERDDAADRLERFRREARVAGRRIHPNIVTILDFGEHDGVPFIAMEYVPGDNVDTALKQIGRFQPLRAVSITIQVLSALEFAHDNGVIHRDIKPSNILLGESDPIKVADFGIAHLESSDLTIDGDVLGTPFYMAPEQLSGGTVDNRADIFATGLLLYEMLTGEKAFKGRNVFDLVRTMQSRKPFDIWARHPDVPPALAVMVNRALAFDADRRYATAAAFARALTAVAGPAGKPVGANHADETVVLAPAAVTQASPIIEPPSDEQQPPPAELISIQVGSLGAETLAGVTRDLATFIGPLARINVRRAAVGCSDIGLLYRELAKLIDDETDRASFLAKSRERTREPPRTGTNTFTGPGPGSSEQIGLQPLSLPPDALSRIEAGLIEHVGPIARVLVRRHMSRTNSVIDLCRELAVFIPDEGARAKFLRDQRAG